MKTPLKIGHHYVWEPDPTYTSRRWHLPPPTIILYSRPVWEKGTEVKDCSLKLTAGEHFFVVDAAVSKGDQIVSWKVMTQSMFLGWLNFAISRWNECYAQEMKELTDEQ